jgi:hypothetical protein
MIISKFPQFDEITFANGLRLQFFSVKLWPKLFVYSKVFLGEVALINYSLPLTLSREFCPRFASQFNLQDIPGTPG